jgi:hypothetical protein
MNRRQLGLVLAIAASLVATAGAVAFAQDASAVATSDSAAASAATASSAASRSADAASMGAVSDQAVASVSTVSGVRPNCVVGGTTALPLSAETLSSISPSAPSSLAQGGAKLSASGC